MQIGSEMAALQEKTPKMDPKKRFFWKIPQDFELLKKVPQNIHQTGQFGWNRYIGIWNLSHGAFQGNVIWQEQSGPKDEIYQFWAHRHLFCYYFHHQKIRHWSIGGKNSFKSVHSFTHSLTVSKFSQNCCKVLSKLWSGVIFWPQDQCSGCHLVKCCYWEPVWNERS